MVVTCTSGSWQWPLTNPGANLGCSPGVPPACPASFASVPVGTSCSADGIYCDYPEGRCACSMGAGPVRLVDGSPASSWFCTQPAAGCPVPRPLLGSACTQEGLFCDYGGCTVPGGTGEQCSGGIWITEPVACPL
jgi:hypothetical protein